MKLVNTSQRTRSIFVTPSGSIVKHPLYDVESCEQPIVRFSCHINRNNDPYLDDHAFLQFFEDEKISIKWFKTPLIWDNFACCTRELIKIASAN